MALKFAMILEAVDRMSGPAKRAAAGVKDLTRGSRQLAREGSPAARAVDRVSSAAVRMRARLGLALGRVRQIAGRAGLKGLELAARGAGSAIGTLIGGTLRLAAGLAQLAIGAAVLGVGALVGGTIRLGSTFEDLELRLARISGSAAAAKRELRWLVDQKLPVPIEQLGEAFVQARKAGIDTTTESLRALVDEAIGSKKELVDVIEAVKSAKNGDFGALEPFDIQTTRKNGRVILQWLDKTGKRITKNVRDDAREIERALVDAFGERSKGAAEDYGRTLKGMWARLTGWWQRFQLKIADAGIYDKLKEKMQLVLDWLDARLADGSIDRWADNVSKELKKVVDWLGQLTKEDLDDFVSNVGEIADGFIRVTEAIGWTIRKLKELIELASKANMAFPTAFNVTSWAMGKGAQVTGPRAPAKPAAKPAPITPAERARWQGALGSPRGAALNLRSKALAPGAGVLQRGAAPAAPSKVAVGGKLEVELKAPPGWTAVPTRMSSVNPGVPVAFRGKANGGYG